jgi:hypothetical protein
MQNTSKRLNGKKPTCSISSVNPHGARDPGGPSDLRTHLYPTPHDVATGRRAFRSPGRVVLMRV